MLNLITKIVLLNFFLIIVPLVVSAQNTPKYPDGALIRSEGDPKVFVIHNSKKRWIRTPEIFNSYNYNWDSIQTVEKSSLDNITSNTLIRAEQDIKVYSINEGGYKKHIPSPEIFKSYDHDWRDVAIINTTEIKYYPETNLIREKNDPRVYFIDEQNQKRWIDSVETFVTNNLPWEAIQTINSVEANMHKEGPAITINININITIQPPPTPTKSSGTPTPTVPTQHATTTIPATPAMPAEPATPSIPPQNGGGTTPVTPATPAIPATPAVPIQPSPPPAPQPTADIKANSSDGSITITYNTAATITWTSAYATSCVISPNGWTGLSGSQSTGNLTSSTTYQVTCTNSQGSVSDSVQVNVSAPPQAQDTTPPVISNVSATNISSTGATIIWTTDELSDTRVEYGTSASYGASSALDANLTTSHSVSLSSLQPATLYHFRIKSTDAGGNLGVSTDQIFTTLAVPAATPPPLVSKVITTVDPDGNTAWGISMAISRDGFPVISYYQHAPAALKVVKCGNASCTTGSTVSIVDNTIGSIGGNEGYTSIAIGADGFPIISYEDRVDYDLKVVKCGNAACSAGNLITRVNTGPAGYIGTVSSIAIGSDGLPIVSYTSLSGNLIKVVKCGNSSCSTGNVFTDIDTGWLQYLSVTIGSDGFPLISYSVEVTGGKGIRIAKCGNLSCSENTLKTTVDTMTSGAAYGLQNSITIGTDGLPVMSYLDMTYFPDYDLRVLKCGNTACSANNIITVVDGLHSVGQWNSIAIGTDGLPIVSYQDTSTPNDLKVVKCGNASCSANNTTSFLGSGGAFSSIAIGLDGLPVIAYDSAKLTVVKCADAACSQ